MHPFLGTPILGNLHFFGKKPTHSQLIFEGRGTEPDWLQGQPHQHFLRGGHGFSSRNRGVSPTKNLRSNKEQVWFNHEMIGFLSHQKKRDLTNLKCFFLDDDETWFNPNGRMIPTDTFFACLKPTSNFILGSPHSVTAEPNFGRTKGSGSAKNIRLLIEIPEVNGGEFRWKSSK